MKYFTQEDQAEDILIYICRDKNLNYKDELLKEYIDWSNKNPDTYHIKHIYYRVRDWLNNDSKIIADLNLEKSIRKHCTNNNITYEPDFIHTFKMWYDDPANKSRITRTYTSYKYYYGYGPYPICVPTIVSEPLHLSCCIQKWMNTLNKIVVM